MKKERERKKKEKRGYDEAKIKGAK